MKTKFIITILAIIGFMTSSFAQGHHFNITKDSPYFTNGATNQVSYIDFGDIKFWGYMEITLTSGFSHQNSVGKYTKIYEIGKNLGNLLYQSSSETKTSFGLVSSQWKLGEAFLDANNHLKIPTYHLVSTGNGLTINISGTSVSTFDKNLITITTPTTVTNTETRDYVTYKSQVNILDKMGIGVVNPQNWFTGKLLQIKDSRPILSLKSTNVLNTIQFTNEQISSNHYGEFHLNHLYSPSNPESSTLDFWGYPAGKILSVTANGKVGIGVSNPLYKLDVNGNISGRDLVSNGSNSWVFHTPDDDRKHLYIAPKKADGTEWDWSKQTIFTGEGKVLFHNNISVQGKVESKEIKVTDTPTADFVFEESYRLPSLNYIEKHIKEKKHLPEIASAKEMKKNGVNIGNFQIQLLQKIEELTLYTITQEKQLKAQKEKIETLEKQTKEIEELKALVLKLLKDK